MSPLFGFIGMPGHLEMIIILVVLLLLFGNRLPSVMRSLGRGVVEFKRGVHGIEEDIEEASNSVKEEKEAK
jgi:sec-independent protein translocase protein TatA